MAAFRIGADLKAEDRSTRCARQDGLRGALALRLVLVLALAALWGSGRSATCEPAAAAQRAATAHLPASHCQRIVLDGDATERQSYLRPLGGGLVFKLEAVPAGWIVRVLPSAGQRPLHDYAELATPPYNSVTPLALTTDYSFRAQDAVGWNPRRFQFLTSPQVAAKASAAYTVYLAQPDQAASPAVSEAMRTLSELPENSAQGELQILDAHLVPGTANQTAAANLVVSHWASTPHMIEQATDGKPTPLGKIDWISFRVTLYLPADFAAAPGLKPDRSACPK